MSSQLQRPATAPGFAARYTGGTPNQASLGATPLQAQISYYSGPVEPASQASQPTTAQSQAASPTPNGSSIPGGMSPSAQALLAEMGAMGAKYVPSNPGLIQVGNQALTPSQFQAMYEAQAQQAASAAVSSTAAASPTLAAPAPSVSASLLAQAATPNASTSAQVNAIETYGSGVVPTSVYLGILQEAEASGLSSGAQAAAIKEALQGFGGSGPVSNPNYTGPRGNAAFETLRQTIYSQVEPYAAILEAFQGAPSWLTPTIETQLISTAEASGLPIAQQVAAIQSVLSLGYGATGPNFPTTQSQQQQDAYTSGYTMPLADFPNQTIASLNAFAQPGQSFAAGPNGTVVETQNVPAQTVTVNTPNPNQPWAGLAGQLFSIVSPNIPAPPPNAGANPPPSPYQLQGPGFGMSFSSLSDLVAAQTAIQEGNFSVQNGNLILGDANQDVIPNGATLANQLWLGNATVTAIYTPPASSGQQAVSAISGVSQNGQGGASGLPAPNILTALANLQTSGAGLNTTPNSKGQYVVTVAGTSYPFGSLSAAQGFMSELESLGPTVPTQQAGVWYADIGGKEIPFQTQAAAMSGEANYLSSMIAPGNGGYVLEGLTFGTLADAQAAAAMQVAGSINPFYAVNGLLFSSPNTAQAYANSQIYANPANGLYYAVVGSQQLAFQSQSQAQQALIQSVASPFASGSTLSAAQNLAGYQGGQPVAESIYTSNGVSFVGSNAQSAAEAFGLQTAEQQAIQQAKTQGSILAEVTDANGNLLYFNPATGQQVPAATAQQVLNAISQSQLESLYLTGLQSSGKQVSASTLEGQLSSFNQNISNPALVAEFPQLAAGSGESSLLSFLGGLPSGTSVQVVNGQGGYSFVPQLNASQLQAVTGGPTILNGTTRGFIAETGSGIAGYSLNIGGQSYTFPSQSEGEAAISELNTYYLQQAQGLNPTAPQLEQVNGLTFASPTTANAYLASLEAATSLNASPGISVPAGVQGILAQYQNAANQSTLAAAAPSTPASTSTPAGGNIGTQALNSQLSQFQQTGNPINLIAAGGAGVVAGIGAAYQGILGGFSDLFQAGYVVGRAVKNETQGQNPVTALVNAGASLNQSQTLTIPGVGSVTATPKQASNTVASIAAEAVPGIGGLGHLITNPGESQANQILDITASVASVAPLLDAAFTAGGVGLRAATIGAATFSKAAVTAGTLNLGLNEVLGSHINPTFQQEENQYQQTVANLQQEQASLNAYQQALGIPTLTPAQQATLQAQSSALSSQAAQLTSQYQALQQTKATLNTNDPNAVAAYNQQVAAYNSAANTLNQQSQQLQSQYGGLANPTTAAQYNAAAAAYNSQVSQAQSEYSQIEAQIKNGGATMSNLSSLLAGKLYIPTPEEAATTFTEGAAFGVVGTAASLGVAGLFNYGGRAIAGLADEGYSGVAAQSVGQSVAAFPTSLVGRTALGAAVNVGLTLPFTQNPETLAEYGTLGAITAAVFPGLEGAIKAKVGETFLGYEPTVEQGTIAGEPITGKSNEPTTAFVSQQPIEALGGRYLAIAGDVTINPAPVSELAGEYVEQEVPVAHATLNRFYGSEGSTVTLQGAAPGEASPGRAANDLLNFYWAPGTPSSAPGDAYVIAYGGYIGIGSGYSDEIPKLNLFSSGPNILTANTPVSDFAQNPGESSADYIARINMLSGQTGIPQENYLEMSAERQLITPAQFESQVNPGVTYPGSQVQIGPSAGTFVVQQLPEGLLGDIPILRSLFSQYHFVNVTTGTILPSSEVSPGIESTKLDLGAYNAELEASVGGSVYSPGVFSSPGGPGSAPTEDYIASAMKGFSEATSLPVSSAFSLPFSAPISTPNSRSASIPSLGVSSPVGSVASLLSLFSLPSGGSIPSAESEPSVPSVPSVPSTTSVPSRPSRPSGPSTPSVPSTPFAPSRPSIPSTPSIPSIPSQPSVPSILSLPSPTSLPSYPSVPNAPSTPSVPSVPSTPSVPSGPMSPPFPVYPYPSLGDLGAPFIGKAQGKYGYRELSHGLSANPLGDLSKASVVASVFKDPGSYTPPATAFGPTGASSASSNPGDSAVASVFGPVPSQASAKAALSTASLGSPASPPSGVVAEVFGPVSLANAAASIVGIGGGQGASLPSAKSVAGAFSSLASAAPASPMSFGPTGRTQAPGSMAFVDPPGKVNMASMIFGPTGATAGGKAPPKTPKLPGISFDTSKRSKASGFPDPLSGLFGVKKGKGGKRR